MAIKVNLIYNLLDALKKIYYTSLFFLFITLTSIHYIKKDYIKK
jgi:hypothetical protein